MNFRLSIALLIVGCASGTLSATTSYSFGTSTQISFDSGSKPYTQGVWTELDNTGNQQIVCVVGLTTADESNTCGNPGPGSSQHISITTGGQPGNSTILPTGTSEYVEIDGDPTYGAPIAAGMSGLTANSYYQITFYQASNEENGNDQPYYDNWLVYFLPGASAGSYICPATVCTGTDGYPSATNPPNGAELIATSPVMDNPGASSTSWEEESFNFKATATSGILEFVAQAVFQGSGGNANVNFEPPMLDLAAVTSQQGTPEPDTWVLMVIGIGLIFTSTLMRRKTSAAYKRIQRG